MNTEDIKLLSDSNSLQEDSSVSDDVREVSDN